MEHIDEETLMESLVKLVEQHDAFRLCFKKDPDNTVHQYYSEGMPEIKLYKHDVSSLGINERKIEIEKTLNSWIEKLRIFSGPMFLFGVITGFDDGKARLYMLINHLAADGVSARILGNDFETIYAYLKDRKSDMKNISAADILGAKGTSCRQWIKALADYSAAEEKNRDYWEDILQSTKKSNEKINALPLHETRENNILLSRELTSRILKASHRGLETRIDDILLSALNIALNSFPGVEHPCIAMMTHGRQEIADDIDASRAMGWFASHYPVRLPGFGNLEEAVKNTRELLRRIPNDGIGANALWINRDDFNKLTPKILFNYQGEFESALDMDIELEERETVESVDVDGFYISISAHVIKGQFEFVVLSKMTEENTVKFKNEIKKAFDAVIAIIENTNGRL
jgi:hypothetical protein